MGLCDTEGKLRYFQWSHLGKTLPALLLRAVLGWHGAITTGFSPWQCRTESRGTVEQCGCPSRARDAQEPRGGVCTAPTGTQNIKHPLAGCRGISLPGFKYICHSRHLIHCGKLVYSLTCRWREAGLAPSWESGAAAVEEGISAHQHVCCPTARH